jgi:hypothetical protein
VLTVVNPDLVRAIREKRLVELVYKDGPARTVEPHDYGVRRNREFLFVFQISGASRSGSSHGWKWLEVEEIREFRILERRFPGTRADSAQQHRDWDTLFARVS